MQKLRDAPRLGSEPLFFLLAGFSLGEWLVFSFPSQRLVPLCITFLLFFFFSLKKGKACVGSLLLALTLGVLFFTLAVCLPLPVGKGYFRGIVIERKANYYILFSKGRRLYVYEKNCSRFPGEIMGIRGCLSPFESMEWEGRFSFRDYLRSKGVIYSLNAYQREEIIAFPLSFRGKEISFLSSFSFKTRSLLDALLFSHADYSSGLIQKASSLGCLYFLSTSGALYGAALRCLEKFFSLRYEDEKSERIAFGFAMLLLPFGFTKSGVWRVFLLRANRLYHEKKKWAPSERFHALSEAGCLQIVLHPFSPLDTGFLLGYGVSYALSLSYAIFGRFPGKKKDLATAAFVFSFMMPVFISKNAFHLFSFAYSLALVPMVYPFAFFGFLSFLSLPFKSFLEGYAGVIENIIGSLERIDVMIPVGDFSEGLAFAYYLCFILFCVLEEAKIVELERSVLLSLSLVLAFNVVPLGNAFSQEVSFVNVGQGDCILIRDGYDAVMIDTGGNLGFDLAQEVDIPFLRKERIYRVDVLIASHHDYDHIGAAESLRRHFPVTTFIDRAEAFPFRYKGLCFDNYNVYSGKNENEESLVLSLSFMGKVWLFTGDAPISIEKKILLEHPDLNCDILKVGHHGSETSSSEDFLSTLSPEMAIISVGRKNIYGHPSKSVLSRLERLSIPYRRTDEEGTISYRSWKGAKLASLKESCFRYNIPYYDSSPFFASISDGPRGPKKTRRRFLPRKG